MDNSYGSTFYTLRKCCDYSNITFWGLWVECGGEYDIGPGCISYCSRSIYLIFHIVMIACFDRLDMLLLHCSSISPFGTGGSVVSVEAIPWVEI